MEGPLHSLSVSIIIPTLNEAENIDSLTRQIMASGVQPREIIFVDDGSTDGTCDRIRSLTSQFPVRLLRRENPTLGLAGAVIAGARAATGDILVVMDADLSHPPSRLPDLVAPLHTGSYDMVIGSRYVGGGTTPGWPLWRRILSRAASGFAYPLTHVHDSMCGFFGIPRRLFLDLAPDAAAGFKIAFEILVRGRRSLRVREIPIAFRDRKYGKSKMTFGVASVFFLRWLGAMAKPRRNRTAARRPSA